jgi:hypothetical protein
VPTAAGFQPDRVFVVLLVAVPTQWLPQNASNRASAPAEKVDNQNHQCDYKQNVDKPSADMEAEAQKPQNS